MENEKVCEKNCPDYSGMERLHTKDCDCSCHKILPSLTLDDRNRYYLACAMIWHLSNKDKDGNPTTKMMIPNAVYQVWDKKLAQLPKDRELTESEALKIVRKK